MNNKTKKRPTYYEFIFKCMWRATAMTVKVPAKNYEEALKRTESMLTRMMGGVHCQEIKYIGMGRTLQ